MARFEAAVVRRLIEGYGGATDEVRVPARREHVQALQVKRASVHRRRQKAPECAKVSLPIPAAVAGLASRTHKYRTPPVGGSPFPPTFVRVRVERSAASVPPTMSSDSSSFSSDEMSEDGYSFVFPRHSKREYLLAQIRQKNAIIESLLKQVRVGPNAAGASRLPTLATLCAMLTCRLRAAAFHRFTTRISPRRCRSLRTGWRRPRRTRTTRT